MQISAAELLAQACSFAFFDRRLQVGARFLQVARLIRQDTLGKVAQAQLVGRVVLFGIFPGILQAVARLDPVILQARQVAQPVQGISDDHPRIGAVGSLQRLLVSALSAAKLAQVTPQVSLAGQDKGLDAQVAGLAGFYQGILQAGSGLLQNHPACGRPPPGC